MNANDVKVISTFHDIAGNEMGKSLLLTRLSILINQTDSRMV